MNIKKLIKLSISALLYRLPLLVRNNKIAITTEFGGQVFMRGCHVGDYCYIGSKGVFNNVVIGNYCSIAPQVQIGGMEHAIHDLSTNTWLSDKGNDSGKTIIEPDVWIAAGSIIRQGVRIGQGAVIGANSFVNTDIPPYAIAVGSPAKVVRYRFSKEVVMELQQSEYQTNTPPRARKCLNDIRQKFNL